MALDEAASHTQDSLPVVLSVSSISPEQEASELASTIDPSYIIQLIRQLLPTVDGKVLGKRSSARWQEDFRTKAVSNIRSNVAKNNEKLPEHPNEGENALNSASPIMDEKFTRSLDIEAGIPQHLNSNPPPQIAMNVTSDTARPRSPCGKTDDYDHPHTGEVGRQKPEISPKEAWENSVLASTADPDVREQEREEAGCVLWDLAASQSHAEFMVENHILDVLLGILSVPHSDRAREICLGILGNLACHAVPAKAISQTSGLQNHIMQNLFVSDAPSLCEVCRLLSAGLHGEDVESWVKALNSEELLQHILWIAANTMNSLLLEKVTELLLAMVDCPKDNASVLLSGLVRVGLPAVLTDLLDSEIGALNEGTCLRGTIVVDTLLQIAEVLSLSYEYATQLANINLFSLACQVVRISGREEVGPAGISASVLVANLLAEKDHLIQEVYRDASFVKQLVELLPCAGDDPGARNALWSILNRLSNAFLTSSQDFQASLDLLLVLAERCEILIEDLQDHQDGQTEDVLDCKSTNSFKAKFETMSNFLQMMEGFKACGVDDEVRNIHQKRKSSCRLLERWLKEAKLNAVADKE